MYLEQIHMVQNKAETFYMSLCYVHKKNSQIFSVISVFWTLLYFDVKLIPVVCFRLK